MSNIKLKGETSGESIIKAPAEAGSDTTITLPKTSIDFSTAGSDGQFLKTNGAGTLSFDDVSAGTALTGSTDNTVCTVTGANAIQGEAKLTFDGNTLDIDNGGSPGALRIGGNVNSSGRTDDTYKLARVVTPHYHNAEEPMAIFQTASDGTNNTISYGGAWGDANAATAHRFYTASHDATTTGDERFRLDENGNAIWMKGHIGSMGGGVIVAAASSSSGDSGDSPNFKVDFTVPCGNVSNNHTTELQRGFDTGETGKDAGLNMGGAGILIATCICTYYIGFQTKIYHLTNWGNGTDTNCSLDQLHSYTGSGHSSAAAAISLSVQSIDHSTPTLRCTFGGDYWNSNRMTVTWLSAAVASPSMIRPNAMTDTNWGHAKWTGQDPTWK